MTCASPRRHAERASGQGGENRPASPHHLCTVIGFPACTVSPMPHGSLGGGKGNRRGSQFDRKRATIAGAPYPVLARDLREAQRGVGRSRALRRREQVRLTSANSCRRTDGYLPDLRIFCRRQPMGRCPQNGAGNTKSRGAAPVVVAAMIKQIYQMRVFRITRKR